jgi:hypothetical protein
MCPSSGKRNCSIYLADISPALQRHTCEGPILTSCRNTLLVYSVKELIIRVSIDVFSCRLFEEPQEESECVIKWISVFPTWS